MSPQALDLFSDQAGVIETEKKKLSGRYPPSAHWPRFMNSDEGSSRTDLDLRLLRDSTDKLQV